MPRVTKQKTDEVNRLTLRKFKRHSRSPGVRGLLNERVRRRERWERRHRRRSANKAKIFPVPERSPLLNAAACRKTQVKSRKVEMRPIVVNEKKLNRKFQNILDLAFSDPVGRDDLTGDDIGDWSQELSDLEMHDEVELHRSPLAKPSRFPNSHTAGVKLMTAATQTVGSRKDCVVTQRKNADIASTSSCYADTVNNNILAQRNADDAKYLMATLDPTDILKLHPFLMTMPERVSHLKSMIERQSKEDSSDEEEFVEVSNEAKSPDAVLHKSADTFVLGAEANRGTSFDPVPPWFARKEKRFSYLPMKAADKSKSSNDESFARHFAVNQRMEHASERDVRFSFHTQNHECLNENMDFLDDVSLPLGSDHRYNFNAYDSPSSISNLDVPPLGSRSPGPSYFARLAMRAYAFMNEEKPGSPNFFGVPRRPV